MNKTLDSIRSAIEGPLKEKDIIVCDITYGKEGSVNFLTITLDKVGGIDLDEIVNATHIINPIIDELDPISESYVMDVISKERGNE